MKRIKIEGTFRISGDIFTSNMQQPMCSATIEIPEICSPRVTNFCAVTHERKKPSERIAEIKRKIMMNDSSWGDLQELNIKAIKEYLDELVGEIKS